jgi:hypothetical protein
MSDLNTRYNPNYYTNSNPNGNFQENTYNSHYNNFQEAFQNSNTMLERPNYNNQNNTIHNNLGNQLNKETIKEYTIDIDSLDRNTNLYPDPFNFSVGFSNNKTIISNNKYQDTPFINKLFKNVKYIRINNIVFPKIYDVIYDDDQGKYIYDVNKNIYLDRFIVLKIDNLIDNTIYSTNSIIDRKGIKLYQKIANIGNFFRAEPSYNVNNTYFFKDSNLGNINKLDISFYDGYYNKIIFSNLDTTSTDITEIRNPLNKNSQVNINATLGVFENELNTNVNYT